MRREIQQVLEELLHCGGLINLKKVIVLLEKVENLPNLTECIALGQGDAGQWQICEIVVDG